ncbi:hypothetical protein RchiOBHm_Chr6g0249421 [Rosa chinensis]|uniref:Uncharacterized protein n=1 Tax=Rosa chinensis TaxID=74649 RepID=A0A2P6PKA6_ROSCH|nr:hypothetical protein RchiOBHm_Chr6g0249421 [Rosa chinensis]
MASTFQECPALRIPDRIRQVPCRHLVLRRRRFLEKVPQTMQESVPALSSYLCLSLRSRPFLLSSLSHLQTEKGRSSKVLVLSNVTPKIRKNFGELLQKNFAPRLKALLD